MGKERFSSLRYNITTKEVEMKDNYTFCKDKKDNYYKYYKMIKGHPLEVWFHYSEWLWREGVLKIGHIIEFLQKVDRWAFAKLLWERWVETIEGKEDAKKGR